MGIYGPFYGFPPFRLRSHTNFNKELVPIAESGNKSKSNEISCCFVPAQAIVLPFSPSAIFSLIKNICIGKEISFIRLIGYLKIDLYILPTFPHSVNRLAA